MQDPAPHILLFEELLEEVRKMGLRKGVDTHIQVHHLMNAWVESERNGKDLYRLKIQLGTLLCSSPKEQESFYTRFESFVRRYEIDIPEEVEEEEKRTFPWLWALAGLLGVAVFGVAVLIYINANKGFIFTYLETQQQDHTLTLWVNPQGVTFDAVPIYEDSLEKTIVYTGDGDSLVLNAGELGKHTYQKEGTYYLGMKMISAQGNVLLEERKKSVVIRPEVNLSLRERVQEEDPYLRDIQLSVLNGGEKQASEKGKTDSEAEEQVDLS